jgi:hypothetical protein
LNSLFVSLERMAGPGFPLFSVMASIAVQGRRLGKPLDA